VISRAAASYPRNLTSPCHSKYSADGGGAGATGNRTDALARELMEKHGYTRVYNVRGGITRWTREHNPVIRN